MSFLAGIQEVVVYSQGFAFRQGRSVRAWSWLEITTIFSNETFHTASRGGTGIGANLRRK